MHCTLAIKNSKRKKNSLKSLEFAHPNPFLTPYTREQEDALCTKDKKPFLYLYMGNKYTNCRSLYLFRLPPSVYSSPIHSTVAVHLPGRQEVVGLNHTLPTLPTPPLSQSTRSEIGIVKNANRASEFNSK